MSNDRAAKIELDVVPGATTESAEKLIGQLRSSIKDATASTYLTKLAQVHEAYTNTFIASANLAKKFLEYAKAPDAQKSALADEVIENYQSFTQCVKNQKQMQLTNVPELTDDIKKSIPDAHREKAVTAFNVTKTLKSHLTDIIPKHKETLNNIKAQWQDLANRQRAAGAGVQPSAAVHSAPLSSSHGARNQASAQAANANNRPAQGAAVEEKKRNS